MTSKQHNTGDGTASNVSTLPAPSVADTGDLFEATDGLWWVLHTRSRNEKAVAADLDRKGIRNYLPLISRRRTSSGRHRVVHIPLFPGYVFLLGGEEERLAALKTNRVARILEVRDQKQLRADLSNIRRVVQSDEPVDLYPSLTEGSRCRVTSGTLSGLEGVVLRRRGIWRVYVGVEFLGQSAELEIDPALLEMID